MPRAVHVASGAADVQGVSGTTTLYGYTVRESAGTPAAATVILRNGTTNTDPIVGIVELAGDNSRADILPAVDCPDGLFIERAAGSTELVLYV